MHPAATGGGPGPTDDGRPASRRAVRPSGALSVALLLLGLAIAACGGPGGSPVSPGSPTASPSSGGSPAAGATLAPGDAAARLQASLAALAPGYRFESTVTVGGAVATTVTGRVLGRASEMVVDAASTTVTYRAVPPKAWARLEGAAWAELDADAPDGDPLDALRDPQAVEVLADDGDGLRVRATYPARALGLAGDDPVAVVLVLPPDGSLRATYTSRAASGTSVSETTFRAAPDQEPISAPIP